MSLWTWPVVYGAASAAGLLAALLGDGWLDALSWLALGVTVVPMARGLRAMRARPPSAPAPRDNGGVAPDPHAPDNGRPFSRPAKE